MFNEGDLRLALEAQTKKMAAAVDAESEESLKQADTDEWAASLAHHFAVACPELKTDAVWMEPSEEIGVDVSRDPMRAIIDPYFATVRNYPATASSSTCRSRARLMSSSSGRVRSTSTGRAAALRAMNSC